MDNIKRVFLEFEAFQITKDNVWKKDTWPTWLIDAFNKEKQEFGSFYFGENNPEKMFINSNGNHVRVIFGDWFVRDIFGIFMYVSNEEFTHGFKELGDISSVKMD